VLAQPREQGVRLVEVLEGRRGADAHAVMVTGGS
jgi:hypothetical protein